VRVTHRGQAEGERAGRDDRARAGERAGQSRWRAWLVCGSVAWSALACNPSGNASRRQPEADRTVRPGITVLLNDSIGLIRDKRIGLITNQTGVDERGRSTVDLLFADDRAKAANVQLVALFSPEHGIRGTEDRTNLPNEMDPKTGLMVYSLYTRSTIAPPDSTLKEVEVLVVDLQDIGTRTWTYVGVMLFAMHASERLGIPYVVLDRPNPLGGRAEGVLLDSSLADAREGTTESPRNGFALWPVPLRHGLTMGELARMFHRELDMKGRLHVIPVANWRRGLWFDQTKLPWVKPSPNLPNLTSALLYPALVPFEGTNVSVGRGTADAFQRVGAPWLRADSVVVLLRDLELAGVRFRAERFTPVAPGDSKYDGQSIPGVRIEVLNRNRIQVARVGAALLWAIGKAHGGEFTVRDAAVDARLGSPAVRAALLAGEDPDRVMDRHLPALAAWEQQVSRYHLYR
jgi:uncharacterized protein YbbC (DUF1343 family)